MNYYTSAIRGVLVDHRIDDVDDSAIGEEVDRGWVKRRAEDVSHARSAV